MFDETPDLAAGEAMAVASDRLPTLLRLARGLCAAGVLAWLFVAGLAGFAVASPDTSFSSFVESLWPPAQARGITRATFDAAFKGVTPDPALIGIVDRQTEFVKPIWENLASALSVQRVSQGKAKAAQWADMLARMEKVFGVDRYAVLAIWGMETGYGAFIGKQNVIRVLATLAYAKYQGDFAKEELLDALDILQAGDVTPAQLRGSWAGAMGQTQFLPSSFKAFAVDFDGDGRRDIWTSVPDALASTANFLKNQGWSGGQPWGFEVVLPKGFEATHGEESKFAPYAEWKGRGVTRPGGAEMPGSGEATLLIPAGLRGPAFLVTHNFKVIKTYNNSTSYALSVALLGDRIAGRPALVGTWPVKERVLDVAEAKELQTRLKDMGYDVGIIDGKIGEQARDAILTYQAKSGLVPDGFPTLALLQRVRAGH
ncbi:MAG: lytic murein transglycosylase [Methylobacteriaceae bacterium]|nr:lytic murein transglycosylase [Methylobacteriaceae bacterium]